MPLLVMLVFASLLAVRTFETWQNVDRIVALGRLINAIEEYTKAIPNEAIVSLGAQETGSAADRALIPATRVRTDAAVAALRKQAAAAGLVDPMALGSLNEALAIDLQSNRALVDAGKETLTHILGTMRPATLASITLIGRLAVLSTDAGVSRLMLAYNAAIMMNDTLLVERNVRPIPGADGSLAPDAAYGEAVGVAQQDLLAEQFERLAAPEALPLWHGFLSDPATRELVALRRTVLGVGGGRVNVAGLTRWTEVNELRLHAMAPVLAVSSSTLQRAVSDLRSQAGIALVGYGTFMLAAFGLVLALIEGTRRQLAGRIGRISTTMQRLADGDLTTAIPTGGPDDELGVMAVTLGSFRASLVERERLARDQAVAVAALLDEKERLRVTLHAIGDGVVVADADRQVTMMNAAAEALAGWSAADAVGETIDAVLTLEPVLDAHAERPVEHSSGTVPVVPSTGDGTLIRRDGTEVAIDASVAPIFGQDGTLIGSITVLHDVTDSRVLLNRIRQLAHYDALTGLPNRALFYDRLAQAVAVAERSNQRCALLFLDMDRFKCVNDTLGHAVGDMLLREVGNGLALTARESDTVARLGGDEFVVILGGLGDSSAAAQVARKILDNVAKIDRIADHEIDVSFSIGIAIYPDDARDVAELVMRADVAMYQAKESGRNTFVFFDSEMDRATQRRNQLRLRLSKALQLDQFSLLYQPKVDLDTGRTVGAEALIRWHPEPGEVVSPVDFIPIAEELGLILPIGDWVLQEACRQMRCWADQGLPTLPVSINVSMKSLRDPGFVMTLRAALAAARLPARALEIELTESVAMADPEHTLQILTDIRALGVRVSIDDFGTGFSSLSHLRRLPVDTIKIDRSFISNMVENEDDAALVRAIIGIAATMRKHVVAEGVETEAQRAMLLAFGCKEAQGHLFSRPVAPDLLARVPRPEQVRASA